MAESQPRRVRLAAVFSAGVIAIVAGCAAGPGPILVTSVAASGAGSLRSAIEEANESTRPRRIVSELPAGSVVSVSEELPPLVGAGTYFEAGGLTIADDQCRRPSGKNGCSGLVVSGPDIEVHGLIAKGFLLDGIAVRGASARGVRIRECRAEGNLDDGIGISGFASDVLVERCVLEGNGFRAKGKGILVFDNAHAKLRQNRIRFNRDGVTISNRSQVELVGNEIADNYDKGFGVRGASAVGRDNLIVRNGRAGHNYPTNEPAPNADGVRVSLGSEVVFENTRIEFNGDAGIVVSDTSRFVLRSGRVVGNGGYGVSAKDRARVELTDVAVTGNARGPVRLEGQALVRGLPEGPFRRFYAPR